MNDLYAVLRRIRSEATRLGNVIIDIGAALVEDPPRVEDGAGHLHRCGAGRDHDSVSRTEENVLRTAWVSKSVRDIHRHVHRWLERTVTHLTGRGDEVARVLEH